MDGIGQQTADCGLWCFTLSGQSQIQDGQNRAETGTSQHRFLFSFLGCELFTALMAKSQRWKNNTAQKISSLGWLLVLLCAYLHRYPGVYLRLLESRSLRPA